MDTKQMLKRLCESCYIGNVRQTASVAKEYLSQLGEVSEDSFGNIRCVFGSGKKVMLDAHIDEIGFIVTYVKDGFVKVSKCGGVDARTVIGKKVTVHGKKEIQGVFSSVPPHLADKNADSAPKLDDLCIDCGADSVEEYVSVGDIVTYSESFAVLQNDRVTCKSLDDRAGVAAVILAAEKLKDFNCEVCVNLSNQEELGARGVRVSAFDYEPDIAIAVDVSFGDGCSIESSKCGKLSKGPMIGISPVLDREMFDGLVKTAEKYNIPYQLEAMGRSTGTNADVISVNKSGVKTALVSIPLRNMHTGVEVVDVKDIENTADLIAKYVGGVK